MRHLAKSFDIHLGAFIDDPVDQQHVKMLETLCASTCFITRGGRSRALRLPGGWVSNLPLSVALWRDEQMTRFVERAVQGGTNHAYVFSGQMASYVLRHVCQKMTVVMDFVDVDSEKFAQYARSVKWPMSSVYRREAGRLRQFEKQVARSVDATLFVSEQEARLFRKRGGSYAHTVYALENGVDLDYFAPQPGSEATDRPGLVFTGAMDYRPNIEAVEWMVEEVLPMVRQKVPETRFTIVGGNPPASVRRLKTRKHVEVTGRVDDVRPYIAAAQVAVAPMQTARGIQNKVLEAMAMGKPVVATSPAYSGIDAVSDTHLVVRDEPEAFSRAVVELLKDKERRLHMGTAARRKVTERYSWDSRLRVLDDILVRHRQPGSRVAS